MMKRGMLIALCCPMWMTSALAQTTAPNPETHFNLAKAHLDAGRAQLAVEEFERALKQSPKNPYYLKGLGVAYLKLNDYQRAIDCFRKAIEISPYYIDLRNDLGTALILAGRREEGKQEILTVYHDPTNTTPEVSARNLGQAFFDEKRYEEALSWYRTSAARNPKYPDAHIGIADSLVALGRIEAAILHLEQAVNDTGEYYSLVLALGEVYLRAGRFTDARKRLEQVSSQSESAAAARRASELLKRIPQ
jgi:protein O-GlcNAc transferase